MIFNNGTIYAKVWNVEKQEGKKYFTLQISTYEKGNDGEYVYSSWFPRVIGHAFNSLQNVEKGDRIVITKSKFSNEKYTASDGTNKSSFKFLILEAKKEDGDAQSESQSDNDRTEDQTNQNDNALENPLEATSADEADNSPPW